MDNGAFYPNKKQGACDPLSPAITALYYISSSCKVNGGIMCIFILLHHFDLQILGHMNHTCVNLLVFPEVFLFYEIT